MQVLYEIEENATSFRTSTDDRVILSDSYISEHEECVQLFSEWSELEQVDFVEQLLAKMCHSQLGQVDCFLRPMLQRDFISALPGILSLMKHSRLSLLGVVAQFFCTISQDLPEFETLFAKSMSSLVKQE